MRSLGHPGARSQRRVGAGLRDMRAWPGCAYVASASSPDVAGEGGVHHRPREALAPLPETLPHASSFSCVHLG